MNKYKNKYFLYKDVYFHIKDVHPQYSSAINLVELDDWAGNIFTSYSSYYLNNNNLMMEMSDQFLASSNEVSSYSFQNELIKQVNRCIDEIKNGNSIPILNFKKTDKRIQMLRKYYGKP